MKKLLFTAIGFMMMSLVYGQEKTERLDKVLQQIEEIKAASYSITMTASAPGDTLAFNSFDLFMNMYINPADTFIGASYTMSPVKNHNEYMACCDANYYVKFDWTNRIAQIDTLTPNLFGRPMAPFFVKVKSLIQYTKDNMDNVEVKYTEFKDSMKINICFKDKIVEPVGLKPYVIESEGRSSKYEIIVDKNFLPYKLIRIMPLQTSWEACSDIQVSKQLDFEFSAIQQIPIDFKIKGKENGEFQTYKIEGTTAPDWKLKEINGDSLSLSDIKQKVILIQFTGIGCGYCHTSIPFLNKLANDYKNKNLELVSIETWSSNIASIERYKLKNEIKYKVLVSKDEIKDKYLIQAVPIFLILDNKRVIKKVIAGYRENETDKEIIKIIDEML